MYSQRPTLRRLTSAACLYLARDCLKLRNLVTTSFGRNVAAHSRKM